MFNRKRSNGRLCRAAPAAVLAASLLALAGCVTAPPRPAYGYSVPPPDTTVYAYPERGQSADEQSRDRYECSLWAVKQSGFDPSAPDVPQAYRVRVAGGPPPGTGTAIGAIAGAVLGAAMAGDDDAGAGAAFGALTGAMIGNASDAARAQQNEAMMSAQAQQQQAALAHGAADYRRALGACLDARGYSVR
jgi:hypothetical protein